MSEPVSGATAPITRVASLPCVAAPITRVASRSGRPPSKARARRRRIAFAGVALVAAFASTACSTRNVDDRIINRYGLDVYLRSEKKIFGPTIARGFDHPSDIEVARLRRILGSIEIERKEGARTVLGPAVAAELLEPVSAGVAEAFRRADPDQEIVVMALRKQMQKFIFDRKYLTSFVAFMKDDELYLYFSRSDWELDEKRKGPLPLPNVEDPQQKFRMVSSRYIEGAGRGGVKVDWRNAVFSDYAGDPGAGSAAGAASTASESDDGAASSAAEPGQTKSVLMEARPGELPPLAPLTAEQFERLSPDDMRRLADLEDARKAGELKEEQYRIERARILERAGAN